MKTLKLVIAGLLLVAMLLVIGQNLATVELAFLAWTIDLPIAVPVVLAFVLGALLGRPLFRFFRAERRQLKRDAEIRRRVEKSNYQQRPV
jgi:uncharacterized integral membrane protein